MSSPIIHLSSPIIHIENLTAGYPGKVVLQNLDLCVPQADMIVLTGPNGVGKTTLFKVILGLITPSVGTVTVLDEVMNHKTAHRLRRKIGYVPQQGVPGKLPMTVVDAVLLGRWGSSFTAPRGPMPSDLHAVDASLDKLGLSAYKRVDCRDLSGGLMQRVSLARAIVRDPLLILLDEPTTYLDITAQQELLDAAVSLNSACGIAFIMISHDARVLGKTGENERMRHLELRDGKVN